MNDLRNTCRTVFVREITLSRTKVLSHEEGRRAAGPASRVTHFSMNDIQFPSFHQGKLMGNSSLSEILRESIYKKVIFNQLRAVSENYPPANEGFPPYGVTWKKDQEFIMNESLNPDGRFYAGTPRVSDGQLLFVQHMLSKMENDGARIGVVTNGSPLFSGGAGSGESNIRRWIIENDWLECIVSLPKDLFYNTGIYTYIWFLTNKKSAERKGKIQLINAVDFCSPASKSLGNKRNDIKPEHIERILKLYLDFKETECSKIFENDFFGSLQLTIEQPLRDEEGRLILKRHAKQADSSKRDYESVPLNCDYQSYFEKEVLPHIDKESWIDISKTRINYEINFTSYFYVYRQPRKASDIKESIMQKEKELEVLMTKLFA